MHMLAQMQTPKVTLQGLTISKPLLVRKKVSPEQLLHASITQYHQPCIDVNCKIAQDSSDALHT